MACKYTLDWLDSLINISLNPVKSRLDANAITLNLIQDITLAIEKEKGKHQQILNDEVFRLLQKEKIEILVNQYYSTLISLLDQSWLNQRNSETSNPLLQPVYLALIQNLEELITFIEIRFYRYINLDQGVPITHLSILKEQLSLFLTTDLPRLKIKSNDSLLLDIISRTLLSFLKDIEIGSTIILRKARYLQGLVKDLQDLSRQDNSPSLTEELIDLLFYLNFNSPALTHYLTNHINNTLTTYPEISGKLEALLLFRKEFSQKHCNTNIALNPKENDLSSLLRNWFNQEIWYWKNKYQLSQKSQQTTVEANLKKSEESHKITCNLSVDQISLLLRASADLQVVKARSLNVVFKKIVPHLSTPTKADLSWDSMRSKSYAVEKRDKEIVIQTLEKMIRKVKEY